jgi:hypothetical protein
MCVFLCPMNMLKGYNFFSTFELNAWEDTWIVAIEALQEGKMKVNKVGKEKEKKKWYNLWAIHQYLQIRFKLKQARFQKL